MLVATGGSWSVPGTNYAIAGTVNWRLSVPDRRTIQLDTALFQ